MLSSTRSDELLITQLCEHQPEAIAWFTPVFDRQNGNEAVVTDFEVQYCNIACCEKKGLTKELIIGQRVLRDGFPDPSIRERKFEQCLSVLQSGKPIQYAYFSTYFEKYFLLSRVRVADGILVTSRDLTELYVTNQELQRQAKEYEQLARQFDRTINTSADGIVTLAAIRDNENNITDFQITQCNEAGFRMGRLPKDAVGRTLLDVLPQLKATAYFDIHKRVVETGEPFSAEVPFKHDPANERWFIVSLAKLDDGLVSNFIDVTHTREAESKAMEKAKELDAIFQTSLNAMYLAEAIRSEDGEIVDLKFLRVNQTFLAMFKFTEEELLQNSLLTISPVTRTTSFLADFSSTLQNGTALQKTLYYPHIDHWYEYSMVPMDKNNVSVSFSDITVLKRKEVQLEQTIQALKRSNESLEEFTRAASHDLKEPIRKVQFYSDLLRKRIADRLDQEEQHFLERMDDATKRMKLLIDDLLEYAHIESNGREKEEIDLHQKIKQILADLEVLIKEKDAIITVGDLPLIKGHRRQIQQLFQNLLSNALKYQKPGVRPEITIQSKRVKGNESEMNLPLKCHDREYDLIEIIDNGIGFDQSDAERIFNVFTRLHGNYEYSGTGIGLSIVRKVVDNHNGFISATGEVGKGATFKVLLPVL